MKKIEYDVKLPKRRSKINADEFHCDEEFKISMSIREEKCTKHQSLLQKFFDIVNAIRCNCDWLIFNNVCRLRKFFIGNCKEIIIQIYTYLDRQFKCNENIEKKIKNRIIRVNRNSKVLVKESGAYCAVISSGKCCSAQVSGSHSVALTLGLLSKSTAKGNAEVAISTGPKGNAYAVSYGGAAISTGIKGKASVLEGSGVAISIGIDGFASTESQGCRSVSLASGRNGESKVVGWNEIAISTGYLGRATAFGKNCVAVSGGQCGAAKGKIGSWIVVVGYDEERNIECVKCAMVDGVSIMPNVYYAVKNGKLVVEGNLEARGSCPC